MSLGRETPANAHARFPRVSGDEPSNGTIGWGIKWFSPRERG